MQGLSERIFIMMNHKIVCWIVVASALISVAAAQNSQAPLFPAKSGADAMNPAIKPLTPKSAMPPHRKSSIGVPNASKSGSSTSAELSRLERTSVKTAANSGGSGALKSVPAKQGPAKSAGSGINATYHKPK
jgi:hypothetical protein